MNNKNSSGFSLLEIIVSMLILSLVVAGLFGLFVTSHKFIIEAGHRLQAINYARQVAETLKTYVSADPDTPPNAGTVPGHALANGTNSLTLIGFSGNSAIIDDIEYKIDPNDDDPPDGYSVSDVFLYANPTGLKQATIRVRWPSEQ